MSLCEALAHIFQSSPEGGREAGGREAGRERRMDRGRERGERREEKIGEETAGGREEGLGETARTLNKHVLRDNKSLLYQHMRTFTLPQLWVLNNILCFRKICCSPMKF